MTCFLSKHWDGDVVLLHLCWTVIKALELLLSSVIEAAHWTNMGSPGIQLTLWLVYLTMLIGSLSQTGKSSYSITLYVKIFNRLSNS